MCPASCVVGDFGLKFDGVFHDVAVLVLDLHSVEVGQKSYGAAVVRFAGALGELERGVVGLGDRSLHVGCLLKFSFNCFCFLFGGLT